MWNIIKSRLYITEMYISDGVIDEKLKFGTWCCTSGIYISDIVRATPLGTGFVDIFIGQIHSESDDQIQ